MKWPRNHGLRALRHASFRISVVGMLLRGVLTWTLVVAIPWYAVELGGDPVEIGIVTGLMFFPVLFLGPFAGVIADRLDRARVLGLAQLGMSIVAGVLAVLSFTHAGDLVLVGALAASFGALSAIALPANQAYLANLVPLDDVDSAVSLHATAWNTGRFVGPAIAGLLLASPGLPWTFVLSSLAAVGGAATIPIIERDTRHRRQRSKSAASPWRDLLAGARYAASSPRIRIAMLLSTAAGLLGIQPFIALAPLYVSTEMGLDGGEFGTFMAMWGAGTVVSAYVVTVFITSERGRWQAAGAILLSAALAGMALSELTPLSLALAGLIGFAQILVAQNALVRIHAAATDEVRGRVVGLYTTVFQGASPVGAFVAGGLATLLGTRTTMLAMAGTLAIVTLLLVGRRRR